MKWDLGARAGKSKWEFDGKMSKEVGCENWGRDVGCENWGKSRAENFSIGVEEKL